MAVGRSANHRLDRDTARAAEPVLDDDGLAELLRHCIRCQTRRHISASAGRKTHQHANRLARPRLRVRTRAEGETERRENYFLHITPSRSARADPPAAYPAAPASCRAALSEFWRRP